MNKMSEHPHSVVRDGKGEKDRVVPQCNCPMTAAQPPMVCARDPRKSAASAKSAVYSYSVANIGILTPWLRAKVIASGYPASA